jgi:hypothetical protein
MSKENISEEVIKGYRNLIYKRYQYQDIINKYDVPSAIDEETVNRVRNYFLDYIYPEFSKREELNEAFESLDSYVKRPQKLLRMLLDSINLLFSHGRHLPKILNTGLKAIKSFRTATDFEAKLAEEAIKNQIEPPFDLTKIYTLLNLLSREEIEEFTENSKSLVLIFRDKDLVKQVKEIIGYLIGRMKKKQDLYAPNEIRGLEIGLETLTEGDELFNNFSLTDQQQLIDLIITVEYSILDEIFDEE